MLIAPGRVANPEQTGVDMPSSHEPPNGGKEAARPRFVKLLRLVHPAPPPKPDGVPRTRSGRRRPYHRDIFTAEEQRLLRASLKTARGLFGTWACLADAMRVPLHTVDDAAHGRDPVTPALAVCLSRALGVPFEALFRPGLRVVKNPCPTCGGGAA